MFSLMFWPKCLCLLTVDLLDCLGSHNGTFSFSLLLFSEYPLALPLPARSSTSYPVAVRVPWGSVLGPFSAFLGHDLS